MQEKNMGHICPIGRSRVKDIIQSIPNIKLHLLQTYCSYCVLYMKAQKKTVYIIVYSINCT